MSHSLKDPRRAWDAGMRDDDYVSIVVFEQSAESPIDLKRMSPVHFISVKDLRDAFAGKRVSITKPKGVEEGSEIRVVWTSAIANQRSTVSEVSATRLRLTPAAAGKVQTVQLSRSKGAIVLAPQVQMNDAVEANQIVAAAVPVTLTPTCPPAVDESYFVAKLASINLSERYAAAKALRYRGYTTARPALEDRMNHAEEDIYVQLEAAAALAAHNHAAGWTFMETKLRSSVLDVPLETQLETLIVASEITKSSKRAPPDRSAPGYKKGRGTSGRGSVGAWTVCNGLRSDCVGGHLQFYRSGGQVRSGESTPENHRSPGSPCRRAAKDL